MGLVFCISWVGSDKQRCEKGTLAYLWKVGVSGVSVSHADNPGSLFQPSLSLWPD